MGTLLRPFSLLILVSLFVCIGCDRQGEAARKPATQPAVPVILKPATVQEVQRAIEVVGTLWADEDVVISNKINGKVIGIYKDVGDRAEPGEPLAQLLRNDYELDRNQKESALQEALTKLGVKEVPGADFDPATLPTVRRAKLQADNAEARYNRGKQLHDNNPPLISDQDFADLRTAWDVAKTAYEVEVLMVRGLVSEARTRQADLAIANQALNDTTVTVPRTDYRAADATAQQGGEGRVAASTRPTDIHAAKSKRSYLIAARMANVGELNRAVTPMFRLIDDDPVKLRAPVPERYISEVKVGQKVDVNIEAYPQTFRGEVARINRQIDPANRTFQVEVVVPNEQHLLPPGAFARGLVQTRMDPNVVFVPLESVVSFAGVNKVFTVKDGKAVEIVVDLGVRRGNFVEILKGVAPGDMVVVSGTSKLASGVPVAVQANSPSPAATAQ